MQHLRTTNESLILENKHLSEILKKESDYLSKYHHRQTSSPNYLLKKSSNIKNKNNTPTSKKKVRFSF